MSSRVEAGGRNRAVPPAEAEVVAIAWRGHRSVARPRAIPEETAIALTYDRATQAVMMATPADLEDFALGFSLTEGIVAAAADILDLDIVPAEHGLELRMSLATDRSEALLRRRRHLRGATGCGLCGLESLAEAGRAPPSVGAGPRISASVLAELPDRLAAAQPLNRSTRAVHAAGFWTPAGGLGPVREDVGRHNALDKLAGALARSRQDPAEGVVVLTSRVSVEMVQKAAAIGAPLLMAVSAPTALALRVAEAAGITLIGVARSDGFEVFTHPARVAWDEPAVPAEHDGGRPQS